MNSPVAINFRRAQQICWAIAGLATIACVVGVVLQQRDFFRAYLLGYLFWSGLALGCFALLMLYHIVGGAWALPVRGALESATRSLPLIALLFVPLLFGLKSLYEWTKPNFFGTDAMWRHRADYLSVPFFVARAAVYFFVWIAFAFFLQRWAREHPADSEAAQSKRLRVLGGWGLIVYCVLATFAAVDWVMSLEPHWFSTIYGMIFIVGQVLTAVAALIIVLAAVHGRNAAEIISSPKPLHDLGNLMFAFVMLWAYLSFIQFLVIWMGNIKEEIPWYLHRSLGAWPAIALALLIFHFAVPFFFLLMRGNKRRIKPLVTLAVIVLASRVVDYAWQVGPEFPNTQLKFAWLFLAAPLAIGGVWTATFLRNLQRLQRIEENEPA